jgi:PAS domain S-box-containing protein
MTVASIPVNEQTGLKPLETRLTMKKAIQQKNKDLVLEAFDTLFNKRDYARAETFWSRKYIQHSAHIEPGREGLFNLVKSSPVNRLSLEAESGKVVDTRIDPRSAFGGQSADSKWHKLHAGYGEPWRVLQVTFPHEYAAHSRLIHYASRIAGIAIERVRSQTALTRAFEQIQKSEAQLRPIVDAIPQMIAVMNPDGTILYVNQTMLYYAGLTIEEVMAKDVRDRALNPEDVARFGGERLESLSRDVPFQNEKRILRKDGHCRWFLTHYNPLLDDQGRVTRCYATGTDINDRVQAEERTRNENVALREQIDRDSMFEDIVGSSDALHKVLRRVCRVAPSDSTILILGETGTGKELIARAIHKRSNRADRAFIGVNCAAIPPSLIASELFGHEKGAFTGATQRRLGRFESANSGTIFLDEVGDLPPEVQIALLRVLQEREIERVGSSRPIPVDVRVLAATHRDLNDLVAEGKFREDLLYRLNVVPVDMPSLRERAADIPLLVEYFIDRFGKKTGKKFKTINRKTLQLFQEYGWPGNIRELQNVIERAVILSDGDTFSVDETWVKREPPQVASPGAALSSALLRQEKEMIEAALAESHGRISGPTGAAANLGLPTQTLDSKIKRLGINKYRFKVSQAS